MSLSADRLPVAPQHGVDLTALAWCLSEIRTSLEQALAALAASVAPESPSDPSPARAAVNWFHQAIGALRFVQLDEVARVLQQIERIAAAIDRNEHTLDPAGLSVIERAVAGVLEWLEVAARGTPVSAVGLFAQYRDLLHLRGADRIEPSDLFEARLIRGAPGDLVLQPLSASHASAVQGAFERGLLGFLRNSGDEAALKAMMAALQRMARVPATTAERDTWWLATALMDALRTQSLAADLPAKRLVTRVAQALRSRLRLARELTPAPSTGQGSTAASPQRMSDAAQDWDRLQRELLFLIATSRPGSPLADAVRAENLLDGRVPSGFETPRFGLVDPRVRDQALQAVSQAKSCWETVAAGGLHELGGFGAALQRLDATLARLPFPGLQLLPASLLGLRRRLNELDESPTEAVAIEVAACLLFIELALRPDGADVSQLDDRASQMKTRIDSLPEGAASLGALPVWLRELGHRVQEQATRSALVDELLVNLRTCEQALEAFFQEPAAREGLERAQSLMMQAAGAMRLLGHRDAADGAQSIARRIRSFMAEAAEPGRSECDLVAAQLGALGFFVESLRQPDQIDSGFEFHTDEGRFTAVLKTPDRARPDLDPDEATIELSVPTVDIELLSVFLTEATEVLQALQQQIIRLRQTPEDSQALADARRAVHTLKGSSRMVGLSELGEVAWAYEQVLNDWVTVARPVPPMLCDGLQAFAEQGLQWVERLEQDAAASIDASPWISQAQRLHPQSQSDDEVRIGQRALSASLYRLFLDEADPLLASLETAFQSMQEQPTEPVPAASIRAAHSLAGSARLVGLDGVGQAARDLEHCFEAQARCLDPWHPADATALRFVLDRLQGALHQFAAGRDPDQDPLLLLRSRELVQRWHNLEQAQAGQTIALEAPKGDSPAGDFAQDVVSTENLKTDDLDAGRAVSHGISADAISADAILADEIDTDLLPIFLEEAQALMPQVDHALHQWQIELGQTQWAASLMRLMHTLKGSARMAGAMTLGQAIHDMESLIESWLGSGDSSQPREASSTALLIENLIDRQDAATDQIAALMTPGEVMPSTVPAGPGELPATATTAATAVSAETASAAPATAAAQPAAVSPLVRVRADLLDRLVNEAGEVAIARTRLDGELSGVHASLADLSDNVARLRTQLREIQLAADTRMSTRRDLQSASPEFDPLEFDRYTRFQELTRLMAESVDDVATVHQNALRGLEQASRDLHLQAHLTRDLQQDLMTIRMVRFASIGERLHRVVRQAVRDTGIEARLLIEGGQAELDRSVLERVMGPLEHLLRNAVAHGIESAADRDSLGKPSQGLVRLDVRAEARTVVIELTDDGRGLDLDRIRRRAIERGLIEAEATLGEAELAQLIFLPGFTTADQVSAIAGRGVGLDVVRAEVSAMGGRIEVGSVPGQGARFSMYLPASMAMSQVVLVRVGDQRFAIGSGLIEQVLQPDPALLNEAHAVRSLKLDSGLGVPLVYLGRLLELPFDPQGQRHPPVLLLRSGSQQLAVHVDEASPAQDVVVKDVGAQLSRMPGVVGATVLGQGDIVLIIDPVQIEQAIHRSSQGQQAQAIVQPARMVLAPTVMVVDDSVTVRKVTQRLLQREGYTVMLARDGLDALQVLEETVPDILLLDIEMPRMDGFELLSRMREQPRLAGIPVVMISSRTADKHREHAAGLGVQAFLGKPYDEAELLELIGRLTTS